MTVERISADDWHEHEGHVRRYEWAASLIPIGSRVNDIACGVGYGAALLPHVNYHGYDRPGVPVLTFPGTFHEVDLNDADWSPDTADYTLCFETLEHVASPKRLAAVIVDRTRRGVFISTPVVPTTHFNPHHLHDFSVDDIPPMFPGFTVEQHWDQPSELSHVWYMVRE